MTIQHSNDERPNDRVGRRPELGPSSRAGSTFPTEWSVRPADTDRPRLGAPGTVVLVGLDATAPAGRALDAAISAAMAWSGRLEVVYVAHLPAATCFSPQAMVEVRDGQDDIEQSLRDMVDERLGRGELTWHFQRRDGTVGRELIAAADELQQAWGRSTPLLLVVGGSAHRYHRLLGSVSSNIERLDRFPVLVVP